MEQLFLYSINSFNSFSSRNSYFVSLGHSSYDVKQCWIMIVTLRMSDSNVMAHKISVCNNVQIIRSKKIDSILSNNILSEALHTSKLSLLGSHVMPNFHSS